MRGRRNERGRTERDRAEAEAHRTAQRALPHTPPQTQYLAAPCRALRPLRRSAAPRSSSSRLDQVSLNPKSLLSVLTSSPCSSICAECARYSRDLTCSPTRCTVTEQQQTASGDVNHRPVHSPCPSSGLLSPLISARPSSFIFSIPKSRRANH